MAGKPKYIEALEDRMDTIESNQDEILRQTGQIHIALMGTEYDQDDGNGKGGGVVRRLGRVEKKVTSLQIWRTKTITKTNLVWILVGGALTAVWSIIIVNWSNIFR